MIDKLVILLLLLIVNTTSFSQKKDVDIWVEKGDNTLVFMARNNTKIPQHVTITLTQKKGLQITKPLAKDVPVNIETVIGEVDIKGSYSYKYKFAYSLPKDYLKNLRKEAGIDKGIVVFDKEDCPRCNFTTNYLVENGISYKAIDISNNEENRTLMWSILKAEGVKNSNVRTPVIVINGKVSYSHKDLKNFLNSIKK